MKNGFTLVELLAVLIILGIISLIALPKINDVINSSRISAGMQSAQSYLTAVNQYVTNAIDTDVESDFNGVDNLFDRISVTGTKANTGSIYVNQNHDVSFCLQFDDYYYTKTYNASNSEIIYNEDLSDCSSYTP